MPNPVKSVIKAAAKTAKKTKSTKPSYSTWADTQLKEKKTFSQSAYSKTVPSQAKSKVTKDGKIIVKGPQTSTKKTREVSNVPFHKTFRESMSAKEKNAAVVGGAAAAGAAAGFLSKKMGGSTSKYKSGGQGPANKIGKMVKISKKK
jgi:hypothetical protein